MLRTGPAAAEAVLRTAPAAAEAGIREERRLQKCMQYVNMKFSKIKLCSTCQRQIYVHVRVLRLSTLWRRGSTLLLVPLLVGRRLAKILKCQGDSDL